jgi:dipeptidyl aminopeptidase/acylaminoacyl peptidase
MLKFPNGVGARAAVPLMQGIGGVLATAVVALSPTACARADEASVLRAAVSAERARPRAPLLDRAQFLAKASVAGAWLSPDGRHVAYLREEGSNRGVWLLPTEGGAAKQLLPDTESAQLSWSRDSRWLFLSSPRQLSVLAAVGQAGSGVIAKLDGRWQRVFKGADPALPAAALVIEVPPRVSRQPRKWRLLRIGLDGKQVLLHEDARPIVDFVFAPNGRLALLTLAEKDRYVIYRKQGDRLQQTMRCERLNRCSFASTLYDGQELLLYTDSGGNLRRLASLDGKGKLTTLHIDPRGEADLDEIVVDPKSGQPVIASYRSTIAANYGLAPAARGHVEAIERRYPGRNLSIDVGSGEQARWLLRDRAGSLKGVRFHLYDPATGDFRDILQDIAFRHAGKTVARPPESAMARRIAFAYRASDGMRLHGFLMVPPGVDAARAPLMAHVHGGPFNLARPEFSSTGQLLVNRGYVVFEPNFRGSTGLGRDYLLSARGDFGNGRVQQDIVDGVRFLLAQGVGDPSRVGIDGASFGGYSALQGVTFQPELFKVGIAAVPPADFGWVLRWYSRSSDQFTDGIPMSTTMRLLSLDPADPGVAERLRVQSPIANAAKLSRPLLLLAGADDERVPIRSVTHYAAELKSLGKDFSLFIDDQGRHQLEDPRTREAYFYLMEEFLHRRLGGAAAQPPGKALREHLRRNLRVKGRDLSDL